MNCCECLGVRHTILLAIFEFVTVSRLRDARNEIPELLESNRGCNGALNQVNQAN